MASSYLKIHPPSVKVLIGNLVSYRIPNYEESGNGFLKISEKDTFLDVSTIKLNPDSHFCILTLKEKVDFNTEIGPLCLPEINNIDYDELRQGTIFGFGYKKDFQDHVKKIAKQRIMKERSMEDRSVEYSHSILGNRVFDAKWCRNLYGSWSLKKKKYGETGNWWYFWMEKYEKKLHLIDVKLS